MLSTRKQTSFAQKPSEWATQHVQGKCKGEMQGKLQRSKGWVILSQLQVLQALTKTHTGGFCQEKPTQTLR